MALNAKTTFDIEPFNVDANLNIGLFKHETNFPNNSSFDARLANSLNLSASYNSPSK